MNPSKTYHFLFYLAVALSYLGLFSLGQSILHPSRSLEFIHYGAGLTYGVFFIAPRRFFTGTLITLIITIFLILLNFYSLPLIDIVVFTSIALLQSYLAFKLARILLFYTKTTRLLTFNGLSILIASSLLVNLLCSLVAVSYIINVNKIFSPMTTIGPAMIFWILRDFLGVIVITPIVLYLYDLFKRLKTSHFVVLSMLKHSYLKILLGIFLLTLSSYSVHFIWPVPTASELLLIISLGILVSLILGFLGAILFSLITSSIFVLSIPVGAQSYFIIIENQNLHLVLLLPILLNLLCIYLAILRKEKQFFESKYKSENLKLRRASRFLPIGIATFSKGLKSIRANIRWCSITGLTSPLSFNTLLDHIDTTDRFRVQQHFDQVLKTDNVIELEFKYNHPSGKEKWLLMRSGKEVNQKNDWAYFTFLSDLSQTRQSQIDKLMVQNQLKELYRQDQFTKLSSSISLDFNHLFFLLKSYIHTLETYLNDKKSQKILGELKEQSIKGMNLSHHLSDFGPYSFLEFSALNLNADLLYLESSFKSILGTEIDLFLDLDKNIPLIYADKELLSQLCSNLMSRAKKRIICFGEVKIKTYYMNQKVYLMISDNGTVLHDFSITSKELYYKLINNDLNSLDKNFSEPFFSFLLMMVHTHKATFEITSHHTDGTSLIIWFHPYFETDFIRRSCEDTRYDQNKKSIVILEESNTLERLILSSVKSDNLYLLSFTSSNFPIYIPDNISNLDCIIVDLDAYANPKLDILEKFLEMFPSAKKVLITSLNSSALKALALPKNSTLLYKAKFNLEEFIRDYLL